MLYVGCDHAGYPLKDQLVNWLKEQGIAFEDMGCNGLDRVDYVDYAVKVARAVAENPSEHRGLLVCGSGIGMSIAANKIRGIRAALCHDVYSARLTRLHNDTNILCMGARVVGIGLATDVLDMWLKTGFEGGRHAERIRMISQLEDK
nr:ribose 5-phosphate isomerase B [bacterium]